MRGTELDDGTSLGNTITSNRILNMNGTFNLEKLYNHIPFLKKTNERFNRSRTVTNRRASSTRATSQLQNDRGKNTKGQKRDAQAEQQKKALPKNQRSYEKEITLLPDTTLVINHGKKTKRFIVSAKTKDGKTFALKYRKVNENAIRITNHVDSALKLKITVTPKEPLENKGWYKTAQSIARALPICQGHDDGEKY